MEEKVIIDSRTMQRTLARLAHEIIEQHPSEETVYLVGIRRRGVPLAEMLKSNIERFSEMKAEVGELDITLYRDDLSERFPQPSLGNSVIPFDVNGRKIVMVDDVIYTGRTARAAMEALISLGRPARIQLAVMVDRGHRELPVSPNYVGKNIPTSHQEFIKVCVPEFDGKLQTSLMHP